MFRKKLLSFLVLFSLCFSTGVFVLAESAGAVDLDSTIRNTEFTEVKNNVLGNQADTQTVDKILTKVINAILGLLGVIFLVLTLFAGFLWMTAAGNDDQVGKAKKILTAAIIGIVIIVSSYAITNFVLTSVLE